MRLSLTKLENITLTVIIDPSSPLCLLFLVRLGGYIVNLCVFYFYELIGKMTFILHLQEFILRNMTVPSSTTTARCSPHRTNSLFFLFSNYGNLIASLMVSEEFMRETSLTRALP
jgi:hypothetical protein